MPKKAQLTIIGAAILLLTVVTITYGFFMTGVNNENQQEISVETGTMELTFADNDTGVSKQLMFGESVTKLFTLENTGTLPASAYIYWQNLTNTYLYGSLVYKLEYATTSTGTKTVIMNNAAVPRSETATEKILSQILTVPSGETYYYTLTITLVLSDTIDQTADLNAKFASSFTLKNTGSSESQATLAALNLTDQVKTEPTTYNMFDYTYNGYYYDSATFEILQNTEIETTEGIYSMEDDFGTSYYFRGSKSLNNIVKFGKYDEDMYYYYTKNAYNVYTTGNLADCQSEATNSTTYCTSTYKYASAGNDMYWRIVRVNGDGSLRLMYIGTAAEATGLNTYAGLTNFNINSDDPKYAGYTYDNSSSNAGDGTSSDIKNYLEKWYTKNMMDEDENIIQGQFFNDTTRYEVNDAYTIWYMGIDMSVWTSAIRLGRAVGATEHTEPTLKTSITDKTYGGVYYLKIGLINADELVLSGIDGIEGANDYGDSTKYPYITNTNNYNWSISPALFVNYDYGGAAVFNTNTYGYVGNNSVHNGGAAVPVINLSAEAAQTLIGSGSTTSPYQLPA